MSVPRQARAGDRCALSTDSTCTHTVMPMVAGKLTGPRLSTSHPDVHQNISDIVKAHVIEYDPVKLGQMSKSEKEAVHFDLKQAVEDQLPDDCGFSAATVRNSFKKYWRKKLAQPAINNSKHAKAGDKRRQPEAEYADALQQEANGTLTEDHPAFSKLQTSREVCVRESVLFIGTPSVTLALGAI